jgi:hypothetical protein
MFSGAIAFAAGIMASDALCKLRDEASSPTNLKEEKS